MTRENENHIQRSEEKASPLLNRLRELNQRLQEGQIPEEAEKSVIQLLLDYEKVFTLAEKGIVNQPDLTKPINCDYSNPIEDDKLLCRPNELNKVQIKGSEEFNPNRTAGFVFVTTSVEADHYGEMKPIEDLTIYPDKLTLLPFDDGYNFGERDILFETPPYSRRLEFFTATITPDRRNSIIGKMPLKVED